MNKKYELTNETINYDNRTLYRIKALKDFNDVKKGDLGGWIEKEDNLSQEGNCWIYGYAEVYGRVRVYGSAIVSGNAEVCGSTKVYGDARVSGNAKVYNYAEVCDRARVSGNAEVCGSAKVYGHAKVYDSAKVYGHAKVYDIAEVWGNARVYDYVKVYDIAEVYGHARVYDYAEVCGSAGVFGHARINKNISNTSMYFTVGPIGSRDDTTTFIKTDDNSIHVNCGCFSATIDEFKDRVVETHGDNNHAKDYLAAIEFIKIKFRCH